MRNIIKCGAVATLVFFILFRPSDAAGVVMSIGNGLSNIATGLSRFVTGLG